MKRFLFALGALLVGGWSVAPAAQDGAPRRRCDAGGRLVSEVRTGEGAYSHAYAYDANDNRLTQTSNPALTGVANAAFVFDGNALPAEAATVLGTWTVSEGKLHVSGTDEAQLNLALTGEDLRIYTVHAMPDTSSLTTAADSMVATGFYFGEESDGRYHAGFTVRKVTEGAVDVLKRKLQILWVPSTTDPIAVVGETALVPYDDLGLDLSLDISADHACLRVVGEEGPGLGVSLIAANGTEGDMGLDILATPEFTPVAADFDDFTFTTGTNVDAGHYVFDGLLLPPGSETDSGAWTVATGKLTGVGVDTAYLKLAPTQTPWFLQVNVKPDLTIVSTTSDVTAGIVFGEKTGGRYFLGLQAIKVTEGAEDVLKKRLRLYFLPSAGSPELVAESDFQGYGEQTSAQTVTIRFHGDSLRAAIGELCAETPNLIAALAHGSAGRTGVMVQATPSLTTATAEFDDFIWKTSDVGGTAEVRNFTYNALNQMTAISGAETTSLEYNDLGQMFRQVKNGITTTFDFDRLNRQVGATVDGQPSAYSYYGPTWMRKRLTVGGVATDYVFDGFACIAQTTAGTTTHYTVPGSTPVWETTSGVTLVYAQDGQGNNTGLWNGTGFSAKFNYTAFGEVKTFVPDQQNPGQFIAAANTPGPRYRGQLYDPATDQVYLRNRYYQPGTGRFGTADPIGYGGGMNLYGYGGGDPVNSWDPWGLDRIVELLRNNFFNVFWETDSGHQFYVGSRNQGSTQVQIDGRWGIGKRGSVHIDTLKDAVDDDDYSNRLGYSHITDAVRGRMTVKSVLIALGSSVGNKLEDPRDLPESLGGALLHGAHSGAVVVADTFTLGIDSDLHAESIQVQEEARRSGDTLSLIGFGAGKGGARTLQIVVVVAGGGLVLAEAQAVTGLTVAAEVVQAGQLTATAFGLAQGYLEAQATVESLAAGEPMEATEHLFNTVTLGVLTASTFPEKIPGGPAIEDIPQAAFASTARQAPKSATSRVSAKVEEMQAAMTAGEMGRTTFAAAEVTTAEGQRQMWVSGAGKKGYVPPRIRGEARVIRRPGASQHQHLEHINDAERALIRQARAEGATIDAIGATRELCPHCLDALRKAGFGGTQSP